MTPEPLSGIQMKPQPNQYIFRRIYRSKSRSNLAYANAQTTHSETHSENFFWHSKTTWRHAATL